MTKTFFKKKNIKKISKPYKTSTNTLNIKNRIAISKMTKTINKMTKTQFKNNENHLKKPKNHKQKKQKQYKQ